MTQLGPYTIEAELGRGGMGVVYRARDARSGRLVALKTLLDTRPPAELLTRFEREGTVLAGVEHPNLVRVLEVHVRPPRPYLAFEYVLGENLKQRVEREGPLPWEEAARVVGELAKGVAALNEREVLHRDVKPENVLLSEGGVKLADYGLLKAVDRESLTRTGAPVGTPEFMSPEQTGVRKGGYTPATDVYGLAATLYYALTGTPPYQGATAIATLVAVMDHPVPSPRATQRGVPAWLDAVVVRGLAKLRGERYPSAMAFRQALLDGAVRAAQLPTARSPRPWILLGAAVAVAGGVGWWAGWRGADDAPAAAPPAEPPPAEPEPPPPVPLWPAREHPWARYDVDPILRADVEALCAAGDLPAAVTRLREAAEDGGWSGEAASAWALRLEGEAEVDASAAWLEKLDALKRMTHAAKTPETTQDLLEALELLRDPPEDPLLSTAGRDALAQRALAEVVRELRVFYGKRFKRAKGERILSAVFDPALPPPEPEVVWALVELAYVSPRRYAEHLPALLRLAEQSPIHPEHSDFGSRVAQVAWLHVRGTPPNLARAKELLTTHAGKDFDVETSLLLGRVALDVGEPRLALDRVEGLYADDSASFAERWLASKTEAQARAATGTLEGWADRVEFDARANDLHACFAWACALIHLGSWKKAAIHQSNMKAALNAGGGEYLERMRAGGAAERDLGMLILQAFEVLTELEAAIQAEDPSVIEVTRNED